MDTTIIIIATKALSLYIMDDDNYFYSNRFSDYYCKGVPEMGICSKCQGFGPVGRTCWECEEEGQAPPSFINSTETGDDFMYDEEMGVLFQLLDDDNDMSHKYIFRCNTCKHGWGKNGSICKRDRCDGLCTRPIITSRCEKGVKRTQKLLRIMKVLAKLIGRMHEFVMDNLLELFMDD